MPFLSDKKNRGTQAGSSFEVRSTQYGSTVFPAWHSAEKILGTWKRWFKKDLNTSDLNALGFNKVNILSLTILHEIFIVWFGLDLSWEILLHFRK